ncbi:MAG: hypothetical protein RML12_00950 [Xanthomonadales bacterium]|nr:hypothetical protein [Xanthomonadales bacterium]
MPCWQLAAADGLAWELEVTAPVLFEIGGTVAWLAPDGGVREQASLAELGGWLAWLPRGRYRLELRPRPGWHEGSVGLRLEARDGREWIAIEAPPRPLPGPPGSAPAALWSGEPDPLALPHRRGLADWFHRHFDHAALTIGEYLLKDAPGAAWPDPRPRLRGWHHRSRPRAALAPRAPRRHRPLRRLRAPAADRRRARPRPRALAGGARLPARRRQLPALRRRRLRRRHLLGLARAHRRRLPPGPRRGAAGAPARRAVLRPSGALLLELRPSPRGVQRRALRPPAAPARGAARALVLSTPPRYIDRAGVFSPPEQYWRWFTELNPITVRGFEAELRALGFEPWRVALRTEPVIEYTPELLRYPMEDLATLELYVACLNRKRRPPGG